MAARASYIAGFAGTATVLVGDTPLDVDAALRKIIQLEGGKSEDTTNEFVEKLKSDKRYKRDVY